MRAAFEVDSSLASRADLPGAESGSQRFSWSLWLFELFANWQERARQRHHLQTLDDRLLQDIGLTRADVEFEAGKHFWTR